LIDQYAEKGNSILLRQSYTKNTAIGT